MATVTGLTATRMLQIEASSIIDGDIVGTDLILTRHDGTQINAGSIVGPGGLPLGIVVATSLTRPVGTARYEGLLLYETDTDKMYTWDGAAWVYRGGLVICTSTTRPAAPHDGMKIYETDTDLEYVYNGASWILGRVSGAPPLAMFQNTGGVANASTEVKMPFGTTVRAAPAYFTNAGGTITCLKSGLYEFTYAGVTDAMTANGTRWAIGRLGALVTSPSIGGDRVDGTGIFWWTFVRKLLMAANDTISFWQGSTTSGNVTSATLECEYLGA
jgi:hypothetical protein